jgi:hypothetical protein
MAACKPSINADEFSNALKVSCTDLGNPGFDNYYGYGLINAEKMLQYVQPGNLKFSASTYTVSEAGPTVNITVDRVNGSSGAAGVTYSTSNGTATAGSDYTTTTGTLAFAAGELSKTFTVPIINDTVVESSETVNLTLSVPTGGATLGTPMQATLTIFDNDAADYGELTTALVYATNLLASKTVGDADGNISPATHDAYQAAIGAATAIENDAGASQAEVDVAVIALANATLAFNNAIIIIDKTALTTAITNATNLIGSKIIGMAVGNVSQAAYDTYNAAIISATAVKDNASWDTLPTAIPIILLPIRMLFGNQATPQ